MSSSETAQFCHFLIFNIVEISSSTKVAGTYFFMFTVYIGPTFSLPISVVCQSLRMRRLIVSQHKNGKKTTDEKSTELGANMCYDEPKKVLMIFDFVSDTDGYFSISNIAREKQD